MAMPDHYRAVAAKIITIIDEIEATVDRQLVVVYGAFNMLELRPNCEYCDCDLPPQSENARICTYECTFCSDCAENVLENVCPNCGGGFTPRPVRPSVARRDGVSLSHQPASTERKHLHYDKDDIAELVATTKDIPAKDR